MAQVIKTCPTCKMEQPIENFAWRNKERGTRRSHCRECCRMMYRKYYHDDGGKNVHRKNYVRNRESKIAYMKNYVRKTPEQRPYNPLKGTAHIAVYRALKNGRMIRPEACESCGGVGKTEAHHHNGYEKEHRLDVVWLCRKCHDLADHPEFTKIATEVENDVSANSIDREFGQRS